MRNASEAQIKSLKAEIGRLRDMLSSVHEAVGEAPESDDSSLGWVVSEIVKELKAAVTRAEERAEAAEARTAKLVEAAEGAVLSGGAGPYLDVLRKALAAAKASETRRLPIMGLPPKSGKRAARAAYRKIRE